MKKFIYSMMALAMTATAFTSCENVPAPYSVTFDEDTNNNTNTPTTPTVGTGTEVTHQRCCCLEVYRGGSGP